MDKILVNVITRGRWTIDNRIRKNEKKHYILSHKCGQKAFGIRRYADSAYSISDFSDSWCGYCGTKLPGLIFAKFMKEFE